MQNFIKYFIYTIFSCQLISQQAYRSVEEIESEWGGYTEYQRDEMIAFCDFLFKEGHYERFITTSFKLLYKLERNNLNLPYNDNGCTVDGWDAANVQISEDDGNTWKVLSGSPEYNCDNCFGFRFNTGDCNIPGWTDIINDWTDAKFSLSEFNGKSIKIRFAFASDPGFSSVDDEQQNITGFHVDNILISNNSDLYNLAKC